MITLSKLLVVLAFTLAVHVVLVSSLIISPSLHENTNANANVNANIKINTNINSNGNGNGSTIAHQRTRTNGISVRSTKPNDLPTIVDLLAFETSGPNGSSPKTFNWKTKMQRLKNIQSLKTQLSNRLSVVNAARELMHPQSPLVKKYADDTNVDIDVSAHARAHQILWSDDSFRNKCEKAIKTTLEYNTYSTLWNNYNFALTPDERLMQHYMITAIDDTFVGYDDDDGDGDGDVVGFCEVGILSNPDVEGELMYCIGNLVVSPNHRQRGIGSKLIKNALRTMRMHGKAQLLGLENVGLYVDGQNENAIGLYEKIGFQVTGKCNHVDDRLFMQMNLLDTDVVASDAVHVEVEDVHAQKYICIESGYGYGSELDHEGMEAFAFS